MKVALVFPSFEIGGVETFLLRLARYLRAREHSVEFIATERRGAWWSRLENEGFVATCLAPERAFSRAACARDLARRLRGFEVVLLNHARLGQAAIPWVDDEVAIIPIYHNDDVNIYELASANAQGWNMGVAVGPKVLSQSAKRVPSGKLVQISYGVDLPTREQLAHRAEWAMPMRLLYLGRLSHSQKGVLLLPSILAGVIASGVDATLTIAGEGPDAERLVAGMAEAGVAGRARCVGAVSNREAYEMLLSHHVLVAPSFHEGFPIGILEAQACGCVPVLSLLEGVTDAAVAGGECGCLVKPGAASEFVAAISTLCSQVARWREMSAAGIEHAQRALAIEIMGVAYERLFEEVRAHPVEARARASLRSRNAALTWRDRVPNKLWALARSTRGALRNVTGEAA